MSMKSNKPPIPYSAESVNQARKLMQILRPVFRRIPLLRPIVRRIRRFFRYIPKKRFLIELRYGILPKIFPKQQPHLLIMPKSDLVEKTRRFWFNNVPGTIKVEGTTVTRRDIDTYGGPDPCLTNPVSQKMEWLSRIKQTNLFEPHSSPQAEQCRILCSRQGDERWTPYHQNFKFAVGCDSNLKAPKCICILPSYPSRYCKYVTYQSVKYLRCDQLTLVNKRRLARSCQFDVAAYPEGIDWSKYDVMYMMHCANNRKFTRPNIPVILYGHEFMLDDAGFQWVIDWLQPDVLLLPNILPWRENLHIPSRTKISFTPFAPSMFFTRPNLDPEKKNFDLLVIGTTGGPIYAPREALDRKIRPLSRRYQIEFSHYLGSRRFLTDANTLQQGPEGPIRYLNQWSAYLGSARYVVFGRLSSKVYEKCILGKYYETLGSGAIPIFPEVPDLDLLGVSPFKHYIPLSEIEGNIEKLAYFLDHYEDYRHIAQNAVEWSVANIDRMLFDNFESLIHEITGKRFPKRLID